MGIVAAENVGLAASTSDLVLMLDDDVVAPPDWVQRHIGHYADKAVGAVGGPAVNYSPDGSRYPERAGEPQGQITWFGKTIGNMHDHPDEWRDRKPIEVNHLVGYNLSFRRSALDRFESRLRPYWQMFEADACLQVAGNGYRVLFDYSNVVEHHPTNPAYAGGRDGDLQTKIFNAAFNRAFVLAKHSRAGYRGVRLAYLLSVGTVGTPGLVGFLVATARFGTARRELRILRQTLEHTVAGWRAGTRARIGK
jgi:GT2 family glycosyltransferase